MRGVRLPRWLRRGLRGVLYIALGLVFFATAGVIAPLIPLWPEVGWPLFAAVLLLASYFIVKGLWELGVKL